MYVLSYKGDRWTSRGGGQGSALVQGGDSGKSTAPADTLCIERERCVPARRHLLAAEKVKKKDGSRGMDETLSVCPSVCK